MNQIEGPHGAGKHGAGRDGAGRQPATLTPTAVEPAGGGLSEATRRRVAESVPASTRRVYAGDWSRFTTWTAHRGLAPLPATPATLAEYTNTLVDAGKAPTTIERALAAISTAHRAAGHERPDLGLARAVLRTHRRERAVNGTPQVHKAAPVTVTSLRAMVTALDLDTPAGVRDRALLVVGFALGARRSELAALDLGDLVVTDAGLQVTIRTSKTDRDSAGRIVALPYGSHPDTCPVRVTQAWLALLATTDRTTGPLFVRVDRHGRLGRAAAGRGTTDGRLTGQAVALIVKRTALAAGLDPAAAWSGHSLRRGYATETYRAGADPLRIARHGGWKDGSATLLGYVEEVDRWRANPLVGVGL
ncbi:site-specific integrase [Rugosimonospora africana]|uniref:Integrase n=1 Tax=Rugosimonospora africana TaxID=556532 RepID=A0A8J3R1K9_9ACTN|nr:site-specific integrase [Rugosimonospora africana]GIH20808.1 integrase [Rugosimonospora africana]